MGNIRDEINESFEYFGSLGYEKIIEVFPPKTILFVLNLRHFYYENKYLTEPQMKHLNAIIHFLKDDYDEIEMVSEDTDRSNDPRVNPC